VTFALRSGQAGFRLAADGIDGGGPPDSAKRAGLADRDDDRFWKGGLIYLNRDDPALMVTRSMPSPCLRRPRNLVCESA
jgi:uncharacterized membrane protein